MKLDLKKTWKKEIRSKNMQRVRTATKKPKQKYR